MTDHEKTYSDSTDILEHFTDVQIDPFLTAVFEKMKLYNELLSEQYVSSNQINEIMNELDDEWRNLMYREVIVTGRVAFAREDSLGRDEDITYDFYEDHPMIFGGVLPIQIDTFVGNGGYADDELRKYHLELRLTREGITSEGGYVEMKGSADIDEIAGLEFPNSMSLDRAKKWLEFYKPDEIADVDVAIYTPSIEECEMTMRLGDIVIDARIPHDADNKYTIQTMQALNIYTNSLFSFDSDVPYQLTVEGEAWHCGAESLLTPASINGSTMSAIDRVVWLAAVSEPEYMLRPHVAVRFLGETKDDLAQEVHVPIAAIKDLWSYRHKYFVGYKTDQ